MNNKLSIVILTIWLLSLSWLTIHIATSSAARDKMLLDVLMEHQKIILKK